jgi:hypothetical protein
MECSSKEGINIKSIFTRLAKELPGVKEHFRDEDVGLETLKKHSIGYKEEGIKLNSKSKKDGVDENEKTQIP